MRCLLDANPLSKKQLQLQKAQDGHLWFGAGSNILGSRFAQSNARTTAVLIDENDTRILECAPHHFQGRPSRLTGAAFQLMNSNSTHAGIL